MTNQEFTTASSLARVRMAREAVSGVYSDRRLVPQAEWMRVQDTLCEWEDRLAAEVKASQSRPIKNTSEFIGMGARLSQDNAGEDGL